MHLMLRKFTGLGRHVRNRLPKARRGRPRLEALESRYAPACTFNPSTGVLTGDGGNNVALFKIVGGGTTTDVSCDGTFFGNTTLTNLTFNGAGGSDSLTVDDTGFSGGDTYSVSDVKVTIASFSYNANFSSSVQNVTVLTGAGDDSIVITNAGNTLDFIPDVTVNAGGGTNTLT